jgi:hypothetical protein
MKCPSLPAHKCYIDDHGIVRLDLIGEVTDFVTKSFSEQALKAIEYLKAHNQPLLLCCDTTKMVNSKTHSSGANAVMLFVHVLKRFRVFSDVDLAIAPTTAILSLAKYLLSYLHENEVG